MLTMIGEMMSGTADSRLDKSEKTLPSSVFGTIFEIIDRMTMDGVEQKIEIPAAFWKENVPNLNSNQSIDFNDW